MTAKSQWNPYVALVWGLPAIVVVASLFTVYLAFSRADDVVADDYYREGLAINQRQAEDQVAASMALHAEITRDQTGISVRVDKLERYPDTLLLTLSHPTVAARDHELQLHYAGNQLYRGMELHSGSDSWYWTLSEKSGNWRLRAHGPFVDRLLLEPDVAIQATSL